MIDVFSVGPYEVPVYSDDDRAGEVSDRPGHCRIRTPQTERASLYWVCNRCLYTKSNPIDDLSNISSNKVTEAEFQTIGPLYLHTVWYLPFTNSDTRPVWATKQMGKKHLVLKF